MSSMCQRVLGGALVPSDHYWYLGPTPSGSYCCSRLGGVCDLSLEPCFQHDYRTEQVSRRSVIIILAAP